MLSVILPALTDEPALIETLAVLVEGVAEGVLRDCVVVSAKPSELFERCVDAAGCMMVVENGPRDVLIRRGAGLVRCDWSLIITPGMVPSGEWLTALSDWMADRPSAQEAAFIPFHARRGLGASITAFGVNGLARLSGRPDPLQGLVVATELLRAGALPRLVMTALDARMVDRRVGT
jgi:hypothetical protein